MFTIIQKNSFITCIVLVMFLCMSLFSWSLGLFESSASHQTADKSMLTLVADQNGPPPIPDHIIKRMRDRGMSEEAIQRMIKRREEAFSRSRSGNSTSSRSSSRRYSSSSSIEDVSIDSIKKFIASAPKVQRALAPKLTDTITLLVTPFELDKQWYRNELAAVNMADLLMAKLNDQPGIQLVDRQQLTEALSEMSLSLGINGEQAMQMGQLLKANMVLRCNVIQDTKAEQSTLIMSVIETRYADVLVQKQLTLEASAQGYFQPTESDITQITQTAQALIPLAIKTSQSLRRKTIIAPLFIRNTTDNERLDHFESGFRQILAKLDEQADTHVLKIAGLDDTLGEQSLGLIGLSDTDPNAWQYVADQYLWGYFHEESHPDNTPVVQIPVTITVYCWDGLNVPIQLDQKTTIGQFEQGIEQIAQQVTKQIQTRRSDQICQGLAGQIAGYLYAQQSHIRQTLPRGQRINETPADRRKKKYCRFLLDLARFFDPDNQKVASERGKLYPSPNYVSSWEHMQQAMTACDYWQQFFQRFATSDQTKYVDEALRFNTTALTAMAYTFASKPVKTNQQYNFYNVACFPPDMTLDGLEQIRSRMLDWDVQFQETISQVASRREKGANALTSMGLNNLIKELEKMADSSEETVRILSTFNTINEQIRQGVALKFQAIKRKRQLTAPRLAPAQTARESQSQDKTQPHVQSKKPELAHGPIDPVILDRVERTRNGQANPYANIFQQQIPAVEVLPPHPALLLETPQVQYPAFISHIPDQSLQRVSTSMTNNEVKPILACSEDHLWISAGAKLVYNNDATKRAVSLTTEIPRDSINDLLIHQGKLYVALKRRGLVVLDLSNWESRTLRSVDGLLSSRTDQLARVGETLLVSHHDHRLSMVNMSDLSITERQVKIEEANTTTITADQITACGNWVLIDQQYLFNSATGKTVTLDSTLRQYLGDQLLTGKSNIANAKLVADISCSDGKVFWLTTSQQLIRLDMQASRAEAWPLPLAQPDDMVAMGQYVYLTYRESNWHKRVTKQRASIHTEKSMLIPWRTHLLVWDSQKNKLAARQTVPGDVPAITVDHGQLWLAVNQSEQWQLARIVTPDPAATEPYACSWISTPLTTHGPRDIAHDIASLAYAGQVELISDWLRQADSSQQIIVNHSLAATCQRADELSVIALAQHLVKDKSDRLVYLSGAIKQAAKLGRLDLFDALYHLADILPADQFSPDHPFAHNRAYVSDPDERRWKSQSKFIASLRQIAMEYDRPAILQALRHYNLPPQPVYGMWQAINTGIDHRINNLIFPSAVAIMRLDRQAFKLLPKQASNQALLLSALGSHDPYYLNEFLCDSSVDWKAFRLDLKATASWLNHQRLNEMVDWACQADVSHRVPLVMPLVLAIKDVQAAKKLLAVMHDVNETQLVESFIQTHDIALLDLLVKAGWDVTAHTPKSSLGRHVIADLRLMDWLITHGLPVNQVNDDGQTLLMQAAGMKKETLCYLLLAAGADHKLKDADGKTAMDWAQSTQVKAVIKAFMQQPNPTSTASANSSNVSFATTPKPQSKPVTPKFVFKSKPRPAGLSDRKIAANLLEASVQNDPQQIMQCLAWGNDLFRSSPYVGRYGNFRSPLMYAASRGQLEIPRQLIEAGDPIDRNLSGLDQDNWTALMYATANGHAKVAALLLDHHANWHLNNHNHQTALDLARMYHHDSVLAVFEERGLLKQEGRVLMRAVMRNDATMLEKLVKQDGYEIDAVDETGQSALFVAMNVSGNQLSRSKYPANFYINYHMMNILMQLGANVNHQDRLGRTVLHRLLQSRLVSGIKDPEETDENWQNAINRICGPSRFMLKIGADPKLPNKNGQTPVDLVNINVKDPQLKQSLLQLLQSHQ